MAYCTETRPYNQGSRLTAYELVYEEIPSKLICDSAVSALMATQVCVYYGFKLNECEKNMPTYLPSFSSVLSIFKWKMILVKNFNCPVAVVF